LDRNHGGILQGLARAPGALHATSLKFTTTDWTNSPFVATHFACGDESQKNSDGAIWCLHAGILRDININNNTKQTSLGSGKFLNGWRGLVRSPLPGPLPGGEGV